MEPSESHCRTRARAERDIAEKASSAEARRAHLELALRYEKLAEGLHLDGSSLTEIAEAPLRTDEPHPHTGPTELGRAFRSAFSLPKSGAFSDLLRAIDEASATA